MPKRDELPPGFVPADYIKRFIYTGKTEKPWDHQEALFVKNPKDADEVGEVAYAINNVKYYFTSGACTSGALQTRPQQGVVVWKGPNYKLAIMTKFCGERDDIKYNGGRVYDSYGYIYADALHLNDIEMKTKIKKEFPKVSSKEQLKSNGWLNEKDFSAPQSSRPAVAVGTARG